MVYLKYNQKTSNRQSKLLLPGKPSMPGGPGIPIKKKKKNA